MRQFFGVVCFGFLGACDADLFSLHSKSQAEIAKLILPDGPPPPDYDANGYDISLESTNVVDAVIKINSNGDGVNFHQGKPRSFHANLDPSTGTVAIHLEGQTFDTAFDSQTGTFVLNDSSDAPGFVRYHNGLYAYIAEGQLRNDGSQFRHNFAYAGGPRFVLPTDGAASYVGEFSGTVESIYYETGGTKNISVPIVAEGGMNISFAHRNIYGNFVIDSERSNGANGRIVMTGSDIDRDATFHNDGFASINVNGKTIFAPGTFEGLIVGPNQAEIAGVVNMNSRTSSADQSVVGAFIAQDTSRLP